MTISIIYGWDPNEGIFNCFTYKKTTEKNDFWKNEKKKCSEQFYVLHERASCGQIFLTMVKTEVLLYEMSYLRVVKNILPNSK